MGRRKTSGKTFPTWYDVPKSSAPFGLNSLSDAMKERNKVDAEKVIRNSAYVRKIINQKNYIYLSHSSRNEVLRELAIRLEIWQSAVWGIDSFPDYWRLHWESIKLTGRARTEPNEVLIEETNIDQRSKSNIKNLFKTKSKYTLSEGSIIHPLVTANLANLVQSAKTQKAITIQDGSLDIKPEYFNSSVSLFMSLKADSIDLTLDLRNSDEAIFQELSELLPKWRAELEEYNQATLKDHTKNFPDLKPKIDNPKAKGSKNELEKIVNYRLIPIIDILIWAAYDERALIPEKIIAETAFPEGIDTRQLTTTYKRFMSNVFNHTSIKQLIAQPIK